MSYLALLERFLIFCIAYDMTDKYQYDQQSTETANRYRNKKSVFTLHFQIQPNRNIPTRLMPAQIIAKIDAISHAYVLAISRPSVDMQKTFDGEF